jgi:hypothetical protein
MKLYDVIIKQIRVKSITDVLVLLFKLAIIIVIADRAYEAIRYLISLFLEKNYYGPELVAKFLKLAVVIPIIYFLYKRAKRLQKKGTLNRAIIILILVSVLTVWANGSILGIFYWNGPYWGRVVDADTGEPVAGAVVAGMWDFEYYWFVHGGATYADTRETVTDEKGRFFLQPARTIWLWPLSRIVLDELNVLKPGYDSHPPRMQRAWTDEDKKKWLSELNLRYPEYRQQYSQKYHQEAPKIEKYFSDPIHAPHVYYSIFRVKCKSYKESIIRLNKVRSSEERRRVSGLSLSGVNDRYKIQRTVEILNRERKRVGMKGRY